MMLEKYVDWDDVIIKALRRHDENRVALANLREEYAAITDGLGAVDYSKDRVDSSGDGDCGMVDRLLQKEAVGAKIKALERDERQYARAWDALTDEDRRVLAEFFQRGRRRTEDAVDAVCDYYLCDRSTAFRKRRKALNRFKMFLVG